MRRGRLGLRVLIITLLAVGLAWGASETPFHTQTIAPFPINQSGFFSAMQQQLANEPALRYQLAFASFVSPSWVLPIPGGSLSQIFPAMEAIVNGYYVNQPATVLSYPASARTFVYVDWFDTRTGQTPPLLEVTSVGGGVGCNFTPQRLGRLLILSCASGSPTPTMSVPQVMPLMTVDSSGSAVTAVTQVAPTAPVTSGGGGGGGGTPVDGPYILKTPVAELTSAQALSLLPSGLLLNTTVTGVLSTYGGSSCTNQILTGLTAAGAPICNSLTDAYVNAANKDGAANVPSLRTLGTGAFQAVAGNDPRLSDSRVPLDNSVTSAKIVDGSIVDADVNVSASIAESKLNLASDAAANVPSRRTLGTGALQAAAGNDPRFGASGVPADNSVTSAKIVDGTIMDVDVNASAAIQESKLNLASDAAAATASRRTLGTGPLQAAAGNDARFTDQRTPLDNSVTSAKIVDNSIVDADINSAAAIAESKLNLASDAAAGTASRRTLGAGALQATAGNDSRLSDARTPLPHAASHGPGQSDDISATYATKTYVDSTAQGLHVHNPVVAATLVNITLSSTQTIDGVAVTAGQRVLVKNQTTASQNGLYDVAAGAWARSSDADVDAEVLTGLYVLVQNTVGSQANTSWILTTPAPITVNTTALTFAQFSSPSTVVGGNGLTLTGNTLDVGAGTCITVGADTVGVSSACLTNTQMSATIQDPVAATPGLRTLGTGAQQAASGTDSRFTDQRTPLDNSVTSTKIVDGAIMDVDVNAAAAIQESKLALASDAAAGTASRRTLGTGALQAAAGNDARFTDQRTPLDNSVTSLKIVDNSIVDADINAAAAIAESKLNLASDAAAGTASRRTLGTGPLQATAGNDARLSDQRTPLDNSVTSIKIVDGAIVDADVNASAAIQESKLALASDGPAATPTRRTLGTGALQAASGNDSRLFDQRTPIDNSVTSAKIVDGAILDADINAGAAIQESKVNLASDAAPGTASRRTLGIGAQQAAAGNDSRFPTASQAAALAGTNGTPSASNQYVTSSDPRLGLKAPVQLATTTNVTLSGEQTIDGVLTAASRILVWMQTDQTQNGLYTTAAGAWTRTTDANTGTQFTLNFAVYIQAGTANATKNCQLSTTGAITIGTSPIAFICDPGGKGLQQSDYNVANGAPQLRPDIHINPNQLNSYDTHADLTTSSQITPTALVMGIQSSTTGNVKLTTGDPRITGCTASNNGQPLILAGLDPLKTVEIPNGQHTLLAGNASSIIVGKGLSYPTFLCNGGTLTWEQSGAISAAQAFAVNPGVPLASCGSATNPQFGDLVAGNKWEFCFDTGNIPKQIAYCNGVVCPATTLTNLMEASSGSQPTCDVTKRFMHWTIPGGSNVRDIEQICDKDDANVYDWRANLKAGTKRAVYVSASSFETDQTFCTDPTRGTSNSNVKQVIFCQDNDNGVLYADLIMPNMWDAGTVRVLAEWYSPTNQNGLVVSTDWNGFCVRSGDALPAPSATGVQTANVTFGNQVNDMRQATSAAITLNGTCAAGAHVFLRGRIRATATTANMTLASFQGIKFIFGINSATE